jgi:hypothetical protein
MEDDTNYNVKISKTSLELYITKAFYLVELCSIPIVRQLYEGSDIS